MDGTKNTKVAIIISTKNRPDFMIRTLEYYARANSPHPIYIGDSSDNDNAQKILSTIHKLKDKLSVHYQWFKPGFEPTGEILPSVSEKYAILSGDDDFQVPETLTKAAEFLENNPAYSAAGGHGIALRLKESGAYGELKSIREYPNHSLEADSAIQRLTDFVPNLFTITFTCVNRVENFRKIWVFPQPTIYTWGELFQVCYCAIAGKVKVIDSLGVVRQIHDQQWQQLRMVDFLLDKDFIKYYGLFREHLSKKIIELDGVSQEQANQVVKESLWKYIQIGTERENKALRVESKHSKSLKTRVAAKFPMLKTLYRAIRPGKLHIHAEVQNPYSPYYKDFRLVMDSFTGKDLES